MEVRRADTEPWSRATSEDISANGIRFRTNNYLPPSTPVDLKLNLPAALAGDATVSVQCHGYVVRASEPSLACNDARIAVNLVDVRLAQGPQSSPPPVAAIEPVTPVLRDLIHRLNTLLFVIMGNSELIASDANLDPRVRSLGTRTLDATQEASKIVRMIAKGETQKP